jgi:hypothetical protein
VRAACGKIKTFSVKGAGTGQFQGTLAQNINVPGVIDGWYVDAGGVAHGFLRALNGQITIFNVKGAGTGAGQGTFAGANNPAGAIAGFYLDGSNVYHGFLRTP